MFRVILALLAVGFFVTFSKVDFRYTEGNQNLQSAAIAPSTEKCCEAIIQVYEARESKWKGLVGTHSWVAIKPSYGRSYTVYQIHSHPKDEKKSFLNIEEGIPDFYYYGNKPELVCEVRGKEAVLLIKKMKQLVQDYPHKKEYDFFTGPNGNTFTQYIMDNLQMKGSLSPLAIGKNFEEKWITLHALPEGYRFNLKGVLSCELSKSEGVVLSLFGVALGLNPKKKEIVLPLVGVISFQ